MADGQDVTQDCDFFSIHDNEESYSSIHIHLINTDYKYSGQFSPGCDVSIRIAPQMQWWPIIQMRMMQLHETYSNRGVTLELIGSDCIEKMARKEALGHQKGTKPVPPIQELAEDSGVNIDAKITNDGKDAGKEDCARTPRMAGTSNEAQAAKIANRSTGPSLSGPGSGYDAGTDPIGESKGGTAKNQKNATGVNYAGGNDQNRLTNAQKRAESKVITAKLEVVGMGIRGQQNITVQKVGPFASGKWYVKDATISGGKNKGLEAHASLMRGTTKESSDSGVATPIVMYADIYQKDQVYIGPRKADAPNQATLTFGEGDFVKSFVFSFDAIAAIRASKKTTGKAIDPNSAEDPVKEKSSDSGGSGGGSTGPSLSGPGQ